MAEVAGGIREALARLSQRVGEGTVEDNLTELAEAEITFFTDLLPIAGPVLGDHDLRGWLRRGGPHADTAVDSSRSRRQDTGQNQSPAGGPGRPSPCVPGDPQVPGGSGAASGPNVPGASAVHGGPGVGGGSVQVGNAGPGGGPALGPVLGHVTLIGYLEAERQAGRLAADSRPPYIAAALIGACQQYAFVRLLTPPETVSALAGLPSGPSEYARGAVRAIIAGHLGRSAYTP